MPFSSLFNRKGSRKKQSEQISKQNDASVGGSPEEVLKGEDSPGKSELLHAESVSQGALNGERKTYDVIESIQVQSETTILQNTKVKQGSDQKPQCDNYNEITTDVEKSVRRKENEIQMEEKDDKNLRAENVNLCGGGSSDGIDEKNSCPDANGPEQQNIFRSVECTDEKNTPISSVECIDEKNTPISSVECIDEKNTPISSVECIDEKDTCPDANGQEQQNSIPCVGYADEQDRCSYASGPEHHNLIPSVQCIDEKDRYLEANAQEQQNSIPSVPRPQNDGRNEENHMKARSCIDHQPEYVSQKDNENDKRREFINTHEYKTKDIIPNLSQEMKHSEGNDAIRDGKLEIFSAKNEETKMDAYDQEGTPNTSSLTAELSNEKVVSFTKANSSKDPQKSETVVNVSESSESTKEFSSAVVDIHESGSESFVTNYSDYSNSVLPTTIAPDNEHLKNDARGNTESKTGEKIKFVDIASVVELPSANDISSDGLSVSNNDEHVTSDSQRTSDKKRSVATESEIMEVQSGPCCVECEETTSSKEKLITNKNNTESECENVFPKTNQDFGAESSADPALRTQERSSDMCEATEDKDPIDKLSNHGNTGYDTEKVQDNETVSMPPPSISSAIPHDASTDKKSETQTVDDVNLRQNYPDRDEVETKQGNDGNSDSGVEIPENKSSLTADERNDISRSQDGLDMLAVQTTSPLEDSMDSFPSECEDFLGGQRTLMAVEQHPPPSWKVGYLQVKLPAKSRGRGKLKMEDIGRHIVPYWCSLFMLHCSNKNDLMGGKVWRQRWVVIQMDEFVKDSKNPSLMFNIYSSECSNARRHSALFWSIVSASKTVVYRSQSKTHKYAFSISVDNDVVLHLAAESETASHEWMSAIRNLLWPPSPVLQLEKVLHGSDFEVSIIDNEFSFHAGLLGSYGNMKVTSNKLILSHPQTDHVIQEWYLNTLDKFQLLQQSKQEDAFKVVVMHTGHDSSTGSGQIILFCPDAVTMLQSIASTIHKLLQFRTTSGKDHYQKELANLAEWLSPAMSPSSDGDSPTEDYYKIPRHPIRSVLDIPNFSFEKPILNEGFPQNQEAVSTKPSMLPSATSASTFSEDSGISMAIHPDDFLNCSVTSFTIGGRPVRDHTSSESSDGYSPPCTPDMLRKQQETETA